MSTPDRNLYSFNGPQDNGKTIDWSDRHVGFTADVHYWQTGEHWADTLKFTDKLQDLQIETGGVFGGDEDCADFNNECSNIRLHAESFVSGGKYVATVKGGCTGIDIRGRIDHGGSEVDIDYGNNSEQSRRKTTGNILGCWKPDGSPVTVRCLIADKPMFVPNTGPYVFLFPEPGKWYHGIVVKVLMAWWWVGNLFK